MRRLHLLSLLTLLAAAPAQTPTPSKPASAGLSEERAAAVTALAERVREDRGIPGISVALGTGDGVIWERGFGLADVENDVPATEKTSYRLASISKCLTAVAALQLVEAGRLDLDAPVRATCGDAWPEKRWPVTPRQLLGHLAGIRHYGKPGELDSTVHYKDLAGAIAIFKDDPLLFEPGTRYRYSTYGYNLLGLVVERASGVPFVRYLQGHVIGPAGMASTTADDVLAIIPHRCRHYARSGGGTLENAHLADTSNKIPGGGMRSNAGDLVRFALALNDGRLLSPKMVELMWTSQTTTAGKKTGYGMGWGVGSGPHGKVVSHTGGQQGTTTVLMLLPEQDVAVAVMTNLEKVRSIAGIGRRILDAAFF